MPWEAMSEHELRRKVSSPRAEKRRGEASTALEAAEQKQEEMHLQHLS
jgi:hypothetical protein